MSIILTLPIYLALITVQGLDVIENNNNATKTLMPKRTSPIITQLNLSRNHNNWKSAYKTDPSRGQGTVPKKTILLWHKPHVQLAKMFDWKINFCTVKNCIIYKKVVNIDNVTKYDAVIFSEANRFTESRLPKRRSRKQTFIYLFSESTSNYPITNMYNGLFDWVMSYRLTSDIKMPYISIYDKTSGLFVGPKTNMTWIQNMQDMSLRRKEKMKSKTKLGAIFVSNCGPRARLTLVNKMNEYLSKYNLSIDVFGDCGDKMCSKYEFSCDEMLERDYFFYLSFENSFAVDYVTEKLTRAVHTHTVPVVLGGADYSRFMPPGSYINACDRDPAELAETLVRVMSNWTRYYEYFRFTNHYIYVDFDHDLRFICDLCEMLNAKILVKHHSRKNMFEKWYNQDIKMRCQK